MRMFAEPAARVWFGVTCAVALVAVGMQGYEDLTGQWDEPGAAEVAAGVRGWRFLSYFTTQSNLLVALTCGLLALRTRTDSRTDAGAADGGTTAAPADKAVWRVVRINALTGITLTALVHWTLLRPDVPPQGWLWLSDALVHLIIPLLAVGGWLVFGPRPQIDARAVGWTLVWPLAWLAYTLVVGGITGWYPYFFLDVAQLGPGVVAAYCASILLLLLGLSCLFWLGDRRLPRPAGAAPEAGLRH